MKAVVDKLEGGLVPDQVDYNLPDGLFSDGRNVRFRDGVAEKIKGTQAVFGSLSVTAIWAKPVSDTTTRYWVYGNEAIVYGTDGTTHTQISSASYNCPIDTGYSGGPFHGYLVLNDTAAIPQRWAPGLANKIVDLDNWPASTFCKVIRPYGDFLVALRVTQGGVYNPRLLRWSDAAAFGALPGSWDYADPTNQAGITELGQTEDEIIDCMPLRDANIIYKQASTYLMQPVGLPDVFSFRQLFSEAGMLSEDCVRAFGKGSPSHFVVTDSDIIVHDGSGAESIAAGRVRKWFFNRISSARYRRTFVVTNRREREIWVCFPEAGQDFPNLALVWNWVDNTWDVRELGAGMSHGDEGIVTGSELTFAGLVGAFEEQTGIFDESTYAPFARQLVLWNGAAKQALQAETGETFNGTTMSAYIERANMGLTRDVGSVKRVLRVVPKIIGTAGDTVDIFVGSRNVIDGMVTYHGPFPFTIGTDYKIDCRVSGRFISLKLAGQTTNNWKLSGFDMEFDRSGRR